MSERRRRAYTATDAESWAKAVREGIDRESFERRFGITLARARDRAEALGVSVPKIDRTGVAEAKAPPGVSWRGRRAF